jgi:hypothetical protein
MLNNCVIVASWQNDSHLLTKQVELGSCMAKEAYHGGQGEGGGGGAGGAGSVQWCSTVPIGDTLQYIFYIIDYTAKRATIF